MTTAVLSFKDLPRDLKVFVCRYSIILASVRWSTEKLVKNAGIRDFCVQHLYDGVRDRDAADELLVQLVQVAKAGGDDELIAFFDEMSNYAKSLK